MGSPYIVTCVRRVNVIKTTRGFARISKELCSLAQVDFLDNVITYVAGIIEDPSNPEWAGMVFDDNVTRGASALREELASRCRDWHPFVPSYLDLCCVAVSCKAERARRVAVVCSDSRHNDSAAFNRAVVFDYTLKGN